MAFRQNERRAADARNALLFATVVLVATILPLAASAHPDLLLQIDKLTEQLEIGPPGAELYLKRGDLYRRHEDPQNAARDFAAARRLDPDHPLLDYYDGRLSLETGDAASAEASLARYLSRTPGHAKAWVLRGQASIELQQPEKAAAYFALAINHSENPSPELYRLQILATLAMGETHWASAAGIAQAGLAHFGVEVNLLGLATDIALAMDQPVKALAYLGRLPPPLMQLPQWAKRLDLLQCLENESEKVQFTCLPEAVNRLHGMTASFMTGRSGVTRKVPDQTRG